MADRVKLLHWIAVAYAAIVALYIIMAKERSR